MEVDGLECCYCLRGEELVDGAFFVGYCLKSKSVVVQSGEGNIECFEGGFEDLLAGGFVVGRCLEKEFEVLAVGGGLDVGEELGGDVS